MPRRLKNLISSLSKKTEIEKADAQNKQAEDQQDSTKASQPPIEPHKPSEIFHPKDLWQTAYDQLDEEQREILSRNQIPGSKDQNAGWTKQIDEIIQVTEQQYEAYQEKSNQVLRRTSRKILDTLLSYKEFIGAVAGLDPTQHAASAWAIVSLSLQIPQNHHDARNALFESSEFLADVITQCAFIEQKFYIQGHSDIRGHIETAMIKLYQAILRYAAHVRNAQELSVKRNLFDCFTAITGHPLTDFKNSVEKERDSLRKWIELGGYLHHKEDAEKTLLKIDELGESLKLLLEQSSQMYLHVVKGASFDSHVHEHEDFCLPGTRTELLSSITDWVKFNDDKFIFWLNGMAGTGKSTIARTVARSLQEQGLLGASFFFKRGEAERGTATYLVTTIAGQLVTRHKQLMPEVLNAIKADPSITSKFLRDQFDQLLYQPLLKLQPDQSTTIVIVIDALDECDGDEDIRLILHLLFKLQEITSVRLRVVLTSRPELPIRIGFTEEESHQDLILHDLPIPVIEKDIRQFLEYKLKEIRNKRSLPHDWPGQGNIEKLVKMAVPLFISASTACLSIGKGLHPHRQLQKYLDIGATKATQLEKTYLPALRQLMRDDEDEPDEILEEFREIVGVIILLATPLSVNSLALLLQKQANEIAELLDFLHSVLNVPRNMNSPVRILHLSFRDFLLDTKSEFRIDEKETHRQIALSCLRVMDIQLRYDICDQGKYGILHKDIDPQIIQERLPADLQYSCYYWVHHLNNSQGGISESDILSFLQKQFLYWLEALALMGKIPEAAGMIRTLESSMGNKADSALAGFLYDARRFTLQNAHIAGIAPLQLYYSGLVFAPKQSVIKKTFYSKMPKNHMQSLQGVADSWGSNLQTLLGHSDSVSSVAFSPDGLTLASNTYNGHIQLWDTATGTQRQMLEARDQQALAFSPDRLSLASGSNGKVTLWDMATGTQRYTLENISDQVFSVAFSSDGLTLASASGNSISLWDTATGMQQRMLNGHENKVTSVAFSPDGLTLASGSMDETIKIWDTVSGSQQRTLDGHSDQVHSVAFSPDGLTLASASGNSISLWDTTTGMKQWIIEGDEFLVTSVAFSLDGLTLASGSQDATIKLWDTASGTLRHTLKGHSQLVSSVAFSPEGLIIASGSSDMTIKLWDAASGTQGQTLEGHSNRVGSVAFSPDGLTLASGSHDNTIKLWDTASGTQRHTLQGHSERFHLVAFSPDNLTLASCSHDNTIKLWDVSTGVQQQTLEGHSDDGERPEVDSKWVDSVAFSPDGLTLASSSESAIALWDTVSGTQRHMLEGHSDCVRSLAFSPDGLILASASSDETIKLWDTASGTQRQTVEGLSHRVESVAFSPDGLTLASVLDDGIIEFWDTATGTQRQTPDDFSEMLENLSNMVKVRTVAFSFPEWLDPDLEKPSGSGQISLPLERDWIRLGSENLIWLPIEYRSFECLDIKSKDSEKMLALGYENGRLLILKFSM